MSLRVAENKTFLHLELENRNKSVFKKKKKPQTCPFLRFYV